MLQRSVFVLTKTTTTSSKVASVNDAQPDRENIMSRVTPGSIFNCYVHYLAIGLDQALGSHFKNHTLQLRRGNQLLMVFT
jgi:hypothetical protein